MTPAHSTRYSDYGDVLCVVVVVVIVVIRGANRDIDSAKMVYIYYLFLCVASVAQCVVLCINTVYFVFRALRLSAYANTNYGAMLETSS